MVNRTYIYDQAGRLRVFVENKFWAGLTQAQPQNIRLLIFIVPASDFWDELKDRCDEDFEWDAEPSTPSIRSVVSWKLVLKQLLEVASKVWMRSFPIAGTDRKHEFSAFLPLHDEKLTIRNYLACRSHYLKNIVAEHTAFSNRSFSHPAL